MKHRDIKLHIENLVLHDVPVADRAAVGVAMQQELTRLLAEYGLPSPLAPGSTARELNARSIIFPAGAPAGVIGRQIAQSVFGGLRQ